MESAQEGAMGSLALDKEIRGKVGKGQTVPALCVSAKERGFALWRDIEMPLLDSSKGVGPPIYRIHDAIKIPKLVAY